jgi:hypothetical protein
MPDLKGIFLLGGEAAGSPPGFIHHLSPDVSAVDVSCAVLSQNENSIVAGVHRRFPRRCTGVIVNRCSDDLVHKGHLDCRFQYPPTRNFAVRRYASFMAEHLFS